MLIPILYIGLIALLLYLQFAREIPFHASVGSLTVSGATRVSDRSNLARIGLSIAGLSIEFGPSDPVTVSSTDGSQEVTGIQSYAPAPDGVTLLFDDGLSLRFALETDESLVITPEAPSKLHLSTIAIPYSIARTATARTTAGLPVLSIYAPESIGAGVHRVLSLPFGSRIDAAGHRLLFASMQGTFGSARYSPASGEDAVAEWFSARGPLTDEAELQQALSSYLTKSWNGLTGNRFDAATGTWIMRNGSASFSNDALAMTLSEALKRGMYGAIVPVARALAASHDPSIKIAPFVGGMTEALAQARSDDPKRLAGLREQLASKDPALFSQSGILKFALDHGPAELASQLYGAVLNARPSSLSAAECVGLVANLLDAHDSGLDTTKSIDQAGAVVSGCLFPQIARTAQGLFLLTAGGHSDVTSSVHAGALLRRYGKITSNATIESVGASLITSALVLSDPDGFLPEQLTLDGERIAESGGAIPPERLYPWLVDGRYTAKELPILKSSRTGDWLLSASTVGPIEVNGQSMLLSLEFPQGEIEYIAVCGIPEPSGLKLYGEAWHADPQFDQYQAGWSYDAASSTLVVKLLHQQTQEQIEIDF